jgi:hypothetical protein
VIERDLSASEAVEILKELVSGGDAGLEGGAELEVFDEEGDSVFLAALARHVRLDEDGIIWIRPIVGGNRPEVKGEPARAFDLNLARRRALDATEIQREGSGIVLHLRSGELARIGRVSERTGPELKSWDSYYYGTLSSSEQLELDDLVSDT